MQVVFLNAHVDFLNVEMEGFKVPNSDKGNSDRGLIVAFVIAREHREEVEKKLRLFGYRLVVRVSKIELMMPLVTPSVMFFAIAEVHQCSVNSTKTCRFN